MTGGPPTEPATTALDRVGVALVAACGALAGLLEALIVPLYWGSVIVPIAVVLAVVSNVALPRLAGALVPSTAAALAPFLGWLIVVVGFGVVSRPEGDVILPGSPSSLVFVTYGLLLGGALAGTVTVVLVSPPKRVNR